MTEDSKRQSLQLSDWLFPEAVRCGACSHLLSGSCSEAELFQHSFSAQLTLYCLLVSFSFFFVFSALLLSGVCVVRLQVLSASRWCCGFSSAGDRHSAVSLSDSSPQPSDTSHHRQPITGQYQERDRSSHHALCTLRPFRTL